MWEMILESGFVASIIGFITATAGIVISNNYSKKQEHYKIRFELAKDTYSKLIEIYNSRTDSTDPDEINKQSSVEIFTNNLAALYQSYSQKVEELKRSYMSIKYALSNNDIKNLENKFNGIEDIGKTLFFSSFYDVLKAKDDCDDITINGEVKLIDREQIPEYMKRYIDNVREVENYFFDIIEKILRKLIS